MTDKNTILDCNSFTNEGVRGNLTISSNPGTFLYLYKGPNLGKIAHFTSIKIGKSKDLHPLTNLNIR